MTPAEFAALVGTARKLITASGTRDAELAARLAAERAAYAAGFADGAAVAEKDHADEVAAARREISAMVGDALERAEIRVKAEQGRYHVCCRECRRRGHRKDCERCEDRSRDTYGNPHPDDYPGSVGAGRAAA